MPVLFLDDCPHRCEAFRLREPAAMIVRTAAECIAQLKSAAWDEVHLDHDLTGETYCESDREDTGMEVVRWLCLNRGAVLTCVVHTHNVNAAWRMAKALEAAGYRVVRAPFTHNT